MPPSPTTKRLLLERLRKKSAVLAEILEQYQKNYWPAVDRADDVLQKALEKRRDKPAF